MSLKLQIHQRASEGGTSNPEEKVFDGETVLIGRDPSCQLILTEPAVSRTHARITKDDTLYLIEDLGSSFGTQVNGRPLPKGEKRLLKSGDIIAIAQYDLVVEPSAEELVDDDGPAGTVAVARKAMKKVLQGGSLPFFRIMNGSQEGERIEIAESQEFVFGRDSTANIILKDDLISRRHAKVRRDMTGIHLEDLESRNGLRVNGKKVTSHTLRAQDEVEIGNTRLLFVDPSDVNAASVEIPPEDDAERTAHPAKDDSDEPREALDESNQELPSQEPFDDEAREPTGSGSVQNAIASSVSGQEVGSKGAKTKRWIAFIFMGLVTCLILAIVVAILVGA